MATTRQKAAQGSYPSLSGKIETAELLRRLKACGQLLTKADQDKDKADGRSSDLDRVSRELISSPILNHTDRSVRLVAACCLSDVLRIYAPDPPYNSGEIQEILELFVKALHVLSNREAKDFSRAYYLLENISIVKLFLLSTELDDADELTTSVFRLFFEIVDEKHSVKIRTYFLDVLSSFIAEQETMPQQVLDAILMQLTEEMRVSEAAGALSRELLSKCASSLEPYVQQHFNRALLVGKSSESDLSEYNLYELIFELNQAAPSVLLSVLPQLEFKLKSTDKDEREEVARLLARMFASPDSSLAEENRPLWRCWLGRFRDIVPGIRCICVQFSKYFLVYHRALSPDIEENLVSAGNDPDESVRSAVIVTLQETALQDITCMTDKLWQTLQKRLLDRKGATRIEAMTALATIFHSIHIRCINKDGDLPGNKKLLQELSWIPSKVFQLYYQPSVDDSLGVERSLLLHLVPVMASDEQRVTLLFDIYAMLDDISMRAFNEMLRKREGVRRGLIELLAAYKAADKPRCAIHCLHIAKSLPDTGKANDHLKQLVGMLKNRSLYDGLQNCTAVEKGCAAVRKAMLGVLKEAQDLSVNPAVLATIKALLDRAAPLLVDSGFIALLLEKAAAEVAFNMDGASDDESEESRVKPKRGSRRKSGAPAVKAGSGQPSVKSLRSLQLVMALATQYPTLFQMQDVYEQLMSFLKQDSPFIVEAALHIFKDVGAEIEKTHPSIASCLGPVLTQLALRGTPRQAKLSLRCIRLLLSNKDSLTDQILQTYLKELDYDKDNLLTIVTGLGHIAELAPLLFAPHQKTVIRNFLVKNLLVRDREGRGFREKDPEWQDESRVSRETQLKIASIKLLVRWLSSLPPDEETASCTPVLRLLHCVLQNEGDLNAQGKTVAWEKSRLRLCAACCLLKVASMERFFKQVDSDMFIDLALMIQDSCLEVRSRFENKLHKWLARMVLPVAYLSILALGAPDPVKDQRNHVRQHLTYSISSRRDLVKTNHSLADKVEVILPEYSVPYLIHLLAHHPDLQKSTPETLSQLKDYLWFFLEPPMLYGNSYGFLKKMIETIKQTQDAAAPSDPQENEEAQKRLYIVCDMALGLMANKATNFTSESFPGRVVIPIRLFTRVPKDAPLNTNKYLPATFVFSPVGKQKKAVDLGPSATPKSRAKEVSASSSSSTTSSKLTSTTKTRDTALPATSPSSRPSRSAKSAANIQLSATKEAEDEDDDSGHESDGEAGSTRDSQSGNIDGIEEFSSSAGPSSESPDIEPSTAMAASLGRRRALKQTTLTEMTAGKTRGRGAKSSSRGRSRSPLARPGKRKTSPPVTPRQAALKSSGPVACSPNIATGNMVMEKLNSTSDDGDRVQPDSAGSSPTRSRATAHSRTGAKRSLTAQLNQPNTADDSESDNAVDAATSSGAAKKRRTAKATSVKDNAASRSRSSSRDAQSAVGSSAASETAEDAKETETAPVLNVKRSSSRRR